MAKIFHFLVIVIFFSVRVEISRLAAFSCYKSTVIVSAFESHFQTEQESLLCLSFNSQQASILAISLVLGRHCNVFSALNRSTTQ